MAKILPIILFVIFINLGLFLFVWKCDPATLLNDAGASCESTSLLTFFFGLYNLDDLKLLDNFYTILAALGGVAILLGVYYVRSDFPVYAAIAAALMLTLTSTLINLWQFAYSAPWIPDNGLKIVMASFVASIIAVYSLFTLLDWARRAD